MKTITEALQFAVQQHQANSLEQAEQGYRQVLEAQPDHPEALYRLGLLMQQTSQPQEAEKLFSAAVQVQPELVKAWFSLGNLRQSGGELSAAEVAYRQALALQPKLVAIHNNLGYTLEQQGKLEEAVVCYQKALELQPNCTEAEVNLGNILNAQGKLLPEQQAHYAKLNNQLGIARQKAGDMQTAIVYHRQAIAFQPDLLDAHYNLGSALQKQEKWEDAIASYHQALKLNPQNWKTYTRLVQVYQTQNKIAEAISVYRQGLTLLNPHYAKAVTAYQNAGTTQEILVTPPISQDEVNIGDYHFPAIPPITNPEKPRPFWTVVIPVYNRTDYLLECLASVLVQWSGAEQMEILVIDNASTLPLFDLVNSIGGGVIRYYRNQQNIGGVRNYNAGIALSRGQWVHVLHDDDYVNRGFYERLQQSLATCPDSVGVACTGFEYINEKGEAIKQGEVVSLYGEHRGIMQDWLSLIGVCGLVMIPAMVVRRTTHERLGGYYPELPPICDWEIFKRLASFYDWWYEPDILACYRLHSEINRLTNQSLHSGTMAEAIRRAIEVSDSYFPIEHRAQITAKARSHNFNYCLKLAAIPLQAGNITAALLVLQEILKIDHSPQAVAKLFAWLTQDEAAPLREEIIAKLLPLPVDNTQDNIPTELKSPQTAIAP
ncbi:tetratricopeptide repeat protein [Nostoc sp. ChiQUE01b]|uniref:tetratricopeptide repeat protein n=1 Tax=Nostoc sp. ChiQUE01b TaxID=3075376 RepID=UPI002AD2841F|nr:tetratricopeptide repeat protein [Nostoc sp. ChiQUE01b]MDZ8260542.1 tetratricopeptide repeat protein [Nostoc sp. ChiQUE01b]